METKQLKNRSVELNTMIELVKRVKKLEDPFLKNFFLTRTDKNGNIYHIKPSYYKSKKFLKKHVKT